MILEEQIARKKKLEEQMRKLEAEIREIQASQKKPVLASIVNSMVESNKKAPRTL